jgi:hypothetical protein
MKTETPWDWCKRTRRESYLRGYCTALAEALVAMLLGVFAWMVWNDWDHLLRGAARVWAWVSG